MTPDGRAGVLVIVEIQYRDTLPSALLIQREHQSACCCHEPLATETTIQEYVSEYSN